MAERMPHLWTYGASPLSLPFWKQRMGYEPRSVQLRKRLVPRTD
jgi:hypothetical protein